VRLRELEDDFAAALEREKMAALHALAYGASHEINNPLANIATRAQTLLREVKHPEHRRMLAMINSQAFRAHEMISDLMLFAKPPKLQPRTFALPAFLEQVVAELQGEARSQGTAIELFSTTPPDLAADEDYLAEALKALCRNSLEALGSGGRIEIATRTEKDAEEGLWAAITVRDTGPGIPADVRLRMFDPYFSGREAGRGLGLGLCKCWRIAQEHGGRIDVESEPGRGATLTLLLPQL
jgi:signal transduction histidine kinase